MSVQDIIFAAGGSTSSTVRIANFNNVLFGHNDVGGVAYTWDGTGYGTKYPNILNKQMRSVTFAPDGKTVLSGSQYGLSSTEWSVDGFGSTTQIATVPNVDRNIVFHPSGSYAVMCTYDGYSNQPFLRVVSYNSVTSNYDIVTKPSSPTGWRQTLAFSPNWNILLMAGYKSLRAYTWDNINRVPGQLLYSVDTGTAGDNVKMSLNTKTGDIALATNNSGSSPGNVNIYPYSSNGFGTKYINPKKWSITRDVKFSTDGNSIAISGDKTIDVYEWIAGTGFGTLISTKTYGSAIKTFEFSPSSDALCVSVDVSPFVYMYEYDSTAGIGNEYPRTSPDFKYAPTLIAFN